MRKHYTPEGESSYGVRQWLVSVKREISPLVTKMSQL
jgi:hypothetical protein